MFTSATGYIFSFGLSRRRHEPPFKPGGSVGALVGRPGFRAGFARIRARGRGRGSVGAACSSRKKPLDLQSSYHLIYSLARPPSCAAAPCSPHGVQTPTDHRGGGVPQGLFCPPRSGSYCYSLTLDVSLNCATGRVTESSGSLRPFRLLASGCGSSCGSRHRRMF